MFEHPVRTGKMIKHFTITKTTWLMLFKEVIAVYSDSKTKPVNIHSMGRGHSY
jgi:hypothetical protein